MRADRIKEKFMNTGFFKSENGFECGSIVKAEMENDLNAMKKVSDLLMDLKGDHDDKHIITECFEALNERINKF